MTSDERPADVLFRQYEGNRDLCVDVAVIDAFGSENHLKEKDLAKRQKYESDCGTQNLLFQPFVLNTLGVFGLECEGLVKLLGSRIADKRGKKYSSGTIREVKQRIQVAAQRSMILGFGNAPWDLETMGHSVS